MKKINVGYVITSTGMHIRTICASCEHKRINVRAARECTLTDKEVSPRNCCGCYKLSHRLEDVEIGKGQIKSPSYLQWAQTKLPSLLAMKRSNPDSIDDMIKRCRESYRHSTGKSIYLAEN